MLLLVRRWYPQRQIVAVADRAYASLKLLERCRKLSNPITFITRLRLDAALYEPAPRRRPHQIGRPRIKGKRLPNLSEVAQDPTTVWKPTKIANWYGRGERMVEIASQTAMWSDLDADQEDILRWIMKRWQLEVTFQEMRRHLGFETQRQWSDLAIRRTTPALLGMFSLETLSAHRQMRQAAGALRRRAAW